MKAPVGECPPVFCLQKLSALPRLNILSPSRLIE